MKINDFAEVLSYIETHIQEKISLKELADLIGYNPYHFSKSFSKCYGMPVTGYIRTRKLQYALKSLMEGKKVLEVSMMYAFESHEGFTRSFTRLFGSTPSTVKKYLSTYQVPELPQLEGIRQKQEKGNEEMNKNLMDNMHELIYEVIRNSIEEAKAGFCTEVQVTLLPNQEVDIKDNGRGIPLACGRARNEEVLENILAGHPITCLEYAQMGDLPKENLRVVNSLCEHLTVKVYRDGKCFTQDYVRGIAQHEIICSETDNEHGTEIILKPDTQIFGKMAFSIEMINSWIAAQAIPAPLLIKLM